MEHVSLQKLYLVFNIRSKIYGDGKILKNGLTLYI